MPKKPTDKKKPQPLAVAMDVWGDLFGEMLTSGPRAGQAGRRHEVTGQTEEAGAAAGALTATASDSITGTYRVCWAGATLPTHVQPAGSNCLR
jgi:hypothetical protein